jgi:hypothetical protein
MAKKDKAIYAPGELGRVRDNLGDLDHSEARRMADAIGGEIGYERSEEQEKALLNQKNAGVKRGDVKTGNKPTRVPGRRVELAPEGGEESDKQKPKKQKAQNPEDDPSVPMKANYWERVKMDKFAGEPQFEIKSSGQVLFSIFSVFGDIPDFVNPYFITKRMREYYQKLETLVVSTRTMFPRNNLKRNERIKKTAPLVFTILDTIRYWNIEKISGELARLQANPKNIKVEDCAEILRNLYRPLFILERMDMEIHIRGAYKILYKALYVENPMEAQNKSQDLIRSALTAYVEVRKEINYFMYPLLMKTVSAQWLPYERFFTDRKNRIMAFLKVSQTDQIDPALADAQMKSEAGASAAESDDKKIENTEKAEESPEEMARRTAVEGEKKALERGINALEVLFPQAGWDKLASFPDLFPYFVDVFGLRRGFVNISPNDPLQQIYILMRIIEELFFGLRYVSFGTIPGSDGHSEESVLIGIINNWHSYVEYSFEKEYLPRVTEYVRMMEGPPEDKNSPYTRKIITDLHWTKRLFFLPYYKFQTVSSPSFQKGDITPIYPEIKKLRRYLTTIGSGIEMGNHAGGAEAKAHCNGINNPWDRYNFQVPNPVSKRLDALLGDKKRNNASLVYFTLAIVTVLDYMLNNADSWVYGENTGTLFRSENGEGIAPSTATGVETKIDADALFRASLKKRRPTQG